MTTSFQILLMILITSNNKYFVINKNNEYGMNVI